MSFPRQCTVRGCVAGNGLVCSLLWVFKNPVRLARKKPVSDGWCVRSNLTLQGGRGHCGGPPYVTGSDWIFWKREVERSALHTIVIIGIKKVLGFSWMGFVFSLFWPFRLLSSFQAFLCFQAIPYFPAIKVFCPPLHIVLLLPFSFFFFEIRFFEQLTSLQLCSFCSQSLPQISRLSTNPLFHTHKIINE